MILPDMYFICQDNDYTTFITVYLSQAPEPDNIAAEVFKAVRV
jgi:hypothetical protein